MKKALLFLVCIQIYLALSGKVIYVSPSGKDSNSGTLTKPYFTLNKAWSVVTSGDTIYLRGGTYLYTVSSQLTYKNATSNNPIKIWAFPGENPVIDYSSITPTSYIFGLYLQNVSYIHLKGIRITNIQQPVSGITQYGMILWNHVSNCTFEQLEIDHIGGWGVVTGDFCNNNLFLNCDSHHNSDRYSSDTWGGSDGFQSSSWNQSSQGQASTGNIFRGCRSYWNSDDGWDLRRCEGVWTLENCWSFWNGYRPGEQIGDADSFTEGGNGEGLKIAGNFGPSTIEVRRIIQNCLIFENRATGLGGWADIEGGPIGMHIYNTTVFKNGTGFGFSDPAGSSTTTLRNNLSYANTKDYFSSPAWWVHDHNNWDSGIKVTDAEFLSVNSEGMDGPRQPDGSLPALNFLKLKEGSALIDAGVDVGLPFDSKAPDLGAFEFLSGLPAPIPAFTSAVIENSTPSFIDLTFDLILNSSITPPISSFNVSVNSTSRKINSISISGNKVRLTLESPVTYGDIIMLSYSKPANNPLQTSSGGIAENILSRLVTNKCQEPVKPNNPPVIVINTIIDGYSGFAYEIDASKSYDLDKDPLTYKWIAPQSVHVSTTSGSRIQFLSPDINSSQTLDFQLTVNDGITQVSKKISINILPYKPECELAKISGIQGSSYMAPNSPEKSSDGILTTRWAASDDNQWLIFTLAQPFKISYLEIAFIPDQNFSSYFDIYVSQDNVNWKPVLIKATSCSFSGDIQVFDFPTSNTNVEYSYIKFIGHCSLSDNQNNVSEIRIFGTSSSVPGTGNSQNPKIVLYPNPTSNILNISIDEATLPPDKIMIFNHSGTIVLEKRINASNRRVQIPLGLESGNYLVELIIGNTILFDQKIIIIDI